jgi:heme A synthase
VMVLVAAVMTVSQYRDPSIPNRLQLHSPISHLAFWTTALVYLVLLSGVLVAEPGAIERCVGWPIAHPQMISEGALGGYQVLRRALEVFATVLILALAYRITRSPEASRSTRRFIWILLVALGLAWLLGWALLIFGFQLGLLIAYVTAAVVLYSALVVITVCVALPTNERAPSASRLRPGRYSTPL